MCKPTTENKRLLAAETFFYSYQTSREINHSIIRFDTPVNFTEIKIISPSQFLSTENGGFMLGATDPSNFAVKFYCNNLSSNRLNIRTYERLGEINYDENICSKIICNNNIWADKLIVSGKFIAITIVIYGTPKDPSVDIVQKKDQTTNLPFFELPEGGIPNILAVSDDFYLDPVLANEFSNLELDSNFY